MSGVKLYERSEALAILDDILAELEGELTPEAEALLSEALRDFDAKAEAVAAKIRELRAFALAAHTESARIASIGTSADSQAESLTRYLLVNMQRANVPKIETPRFKISVRENPPKVTALLCEPDSIARLETMPDPELVACITHTPEVVTASHDQWDKKALLALWKSNPDLVATVAVIERGSRLEMR